MSTTAGQAIQEGAYGLGTGPIVLDNVECTGTEQRLEDCAHLPFGLHNCVHAEDAGVVCLCEHYLLVLFGIAARYSGSACALVFAYLI